MKRYALGFIFDEPLSNVLLIHKLKPEWQAGKVNGLGGKLEEGEDALACIVREIQEESGLATTKEKWKLIGNLHAPDWTMDVLAYVYEGSPEDARSIEEEQVAWFAVQALPNNIMSNLSWLIPICLDNLKHESPTRFTVEYP